MHEELIFFPHTTEPKPFYIELAGISYCDQSYFINRKNSPLLVMEYVLNGEGTIITDNQKYQAKKGDMYLLLQGKDQYYYADAKNPWTKIWFNAYGPLTNRLADIYNPQTKVLFPETNGGHYIEKIHDIGRNPDIPAGNKHDMAALVYLEILQFLYTNFFINTIFTEETVLLKNFIDNNVEKNISLKMLEEISHLSESQIMRIFRKDMGMTPYEYILNQKLEKAKLLLQNSHLRIKDIAFQLGFSSEYYFSALFRKKMGVTASSYRKNHSFR